MPNAITCVRFRNSLLLQRNNTLCVPCKTFTQAKVIYFLFYFAGIYNTIYTITFLLSDLNVIFDCIFINISVSFCCFTFWMMLRVLQQTDFRSVTMEEGRPVFVEYCGPAFSSVYKDINE